MALINFNLMEYIKFISVLSPIFISFSAVLSSFFNQNLKGIVFVLGALMTTFLGKLISGSLNRKPPQGMDQWCNFFATSGLGVDWSAPGPDAMYLAFTFVYMVSGMIFHRNYNWFLMSGLLVLLISNGFFRMKMRCVQGVDIGIGYLVGAICAIGWYFLMAMFESSAFNNQVSLTYFNDVGDDSNKCTLTKKKFKCKKISK